MNHAVAGGRPLVGGAALLGSVFGLAAGGGSTLVIGLFAGLLAGSIATTA